MPQSASDSAIGRRTKSGRGLSDLGLNAISWGHGGVAEVQPHASATDVFDSFFLFSLPAFLLWFGIAKRGGSGACANNAPAAEPCVVGHSSRT